jgi:hypothetical protein
VLLIAVIIASFLATATSTMGGTAAADAFAPTSTEPPVTANEFFPEQGNVTDCIGVLERPGCGSENRGGWRQVLVFGLVAAGLIVIFTKIVIGVRRGRASDQDESPTR